MLWRSKPCSRYLILTCRTLPSDVRRPRYPGRSLNVKPPLAAAHDLKVSLAWAGHRMLMWVGGRLPS